MKSTISYIVTALLMAFSVCVSAQESKQDAADFYVGYGQGNLSVEDEDFDTHSYVAGIEFRQATSIEIEHTEIDDVLGMSFTQDSFRVIASVYDLGAHSATVQLSVSDGVLEMAGEDEDSGYGGLGVGYQWRIADFVSLRYMYNVYYMDEIAGVDIGKTKESALSVVARF